MLRTIGSIHHVTAAHVGTTERGGASISLHETRDTDYSPSHLFFDSIEDLRLFVTPINAYLAEHEGLGAGDDEEQAQVGEASILPAPLDPKRQDEKENA